MKAQVQKLALERTPVRQVVNTTSAQFKEKELKQTSVGFSGARPTEGDDPRAALESETVTFTVSSGISAGSGQESTMHQSPQIDANVTGGAERTPGA